MSASGSFNGPAPAPLRPGNRAHRPAAHRRLRQLVVGLAARRELRAIVVLGLLLGAFFLLLLAIRGDELQRADLGITRALQSTRSAPLDAVAAALTLAGGAAVIVPAGLLTAAAFLVTRRPWAALLCAVTLTGHPLNLALKLLARRPRPVESEWVDVLLPATGTSFPSGHAMASVMFYGFLALMAWILVRRPRRRRWWTGSLIAWTLLIGLSRVYVGGHWFSDVVGGWVVGVFFLLIAAELYRIVGARELDPQPRPDPPGTPPASP
jgi:undecaprenyl-diphosphatase